MCFLHASDIPVSTKYALAPPLTEVQRHRDPNLATCDAILSHFYVGQTQMFNRKHFVDKSHWNMVPRQPLQIMRISVHYQMNTNWQTSDFVSVKKQNKNK